MSSQTSELLTWKNPVTTGKVFGAIIGALVLVKINILYHLFHVAYLALLVSAAAEYAGKLVTGEGFVTKYVGVPQSRSTTIRDSVLPALGATAEVLEEEFHRVVYAQDVEATLKAAGASYILYKLTSWFSLYTLVVVSVLLTFSVPLVYQLNKKEIDAAVAQYSKLVKDKTAEYSATAHKKAAPHFDTFVKRTGPLGQFVQSKFPTRTAGSTVGSSGHPAGASGYSAGSSGATVGSSVGTAREEPTSGVATGASKFPDVPSTSPERSTVTEEPVASL